IRSIPVNQQGKQPSTDHADKINKEEFQAAQGHYHHPAEKVQAEHIEEKMHPSNTQKAGRDQAFVVLVEKYLFYLELIFFKKTAVLKTLIRGKGSGYDKDEYYDRD